jgi:hypothetical protein
MGRRFWYTTYNEAVKRMMEDLEGIAADQGSSSTEVVSQNYPSEAEKRRYRRASMCEELNAVFSSSEQAVLISTVLLSAGRVSNATY